jgi:crotonobetainyl-CoA:carnitine CoA-transferase CaiB-like acyl-CoA transferase
MAKVLPEKTTKEWLDIFAEIDIPAGKINSIDDLLEDPQLKASGLFLEREHPTEGKYIEVRPPVRFSAAESQELAHPAKAGEHSLEIARELGVDLKN